MARIALLGMLLSGTAILFIAVNSSATETEVQNDPLPQWDMRQEIQDASDTERNGWRREMDV